MKRKKSLNYILIIAMLFGIFNFSHYERANATTLEATNSQTEQWITKETNSFIFYFTPKAYQSSSHFVSDSEKYVEKYEEFFGDNTLKNKISIWVVDDTGVLNLFKTAFYFHNDKAIIIPLAQIEKMEGDKTSFVLAHEIIHAFQYAKYPNNHFGANLAWFLEGQADYFAKQVLGLPQYFHEPAGVENWTKEFYIKEFEKRYGSIERNKRDWNRYQKITDLNLNGSDYYSFHSLVYFLIQNYGVDKYKQFSDMIGEGVQPTEAFSKVYNKTEEQLMQEFKVYFNVQ